MKLENPLISFDFTFLEAFDPDLWFVETLEDESLRNELLEKIHERPGDVEHIYDVIL